MQIPCMGSALPSFILQPQFKQTNQCRPSTSILQEGSSYSCIGPSVKSHAFTKGQALSLSVYAPLPCAHVPCWGTQTVKAQFTLCWAQREAGRGCGKELCLFKHVFKKRGGNLLNGGQYRPCCTPQTRGGVKQKWRGSC